MSQQQMLDSVDIVLSFDAKNGRLRLGHRSAKLYLLFYGDRDLLAREVHGLL